MHTSKWLAHSAMTDPGEFCGQVEALTRSLAALAAVAQGLLVHCDCLALYEVETVVSKPLDRSTLPVRDRLSRVLARGGPSLLEGRRPADREVGTCRDFALMLTSFLRTHGTPARCRCGFASYFGRGWADHWVCEYWSQDEGAWRLADAQLDATQRRAFGITFDVLNLPRDAFLPANEAWNACRSGSLSPDVFGHGETTGSWFMSIDVVRDSLCLDGRETSAWDTWRDAPPAQRRLTTDDLARLDALARHPDRLIGAWTPPWRNPVRDGADPT